MNELRIEITEEEYEKLTEKVDELNESEDLKEFNDCKAEFFAEIVELQLFKELKGEFEYNKQNILVNF